MIAISAGHWERARGAHDREGNYEYPETMRWARAVYDAYRKKYGTGIVLVPAEDLGHKVDFVNAAKAKLALEIHFNSCPGGGAVGSETLYYPGSVKGGEIARLFQAGMSSLLPPNRGIKEGWYKMDRPGIQDFPGDKEGDEVPDFFLRAVACPALIWEPDFIQNFGRIEQVREGACETAAELLHEALALL